MAHDLDPAIATLERRRTELLGTVSEVERSINLLCSEAGHPPRYADTTSTAGSKLVQISDDTFYGKKQTPAMREYLEMRRAQGLGPATAREIYNALISGGYVFEAKEEETRLVSMRALLRTQPTVFHRLPQGTWGLLAWYPDAKKSADDGRPKKTAAAKKATAGKRGLRHLAPPKKRETGSDQSGNGLPGDE